MKIHRLVAVAAFIALSIPMAYAAEPPTAQHMQESFQKMQATMDQAMQAKTPAERQKLMAEHGKLMQDQMTAMHGMMGDGGMMEKKQGDGTTDPKAAQQRMQQRMDMMQAMMGQMMQEHQLMMKPAL